MSQSRRNLKPRRNIYYTDPEKFLSKRCSLITHARRKLLYNELAPIYDLATKRNDEREVAFIDSVIKQFLPETRLVLDLGCGVGRHAEMLSGKYGYKITGVDISERMIGLAKRRCPTGNFKKMDMTNLELGEKFDVAICMWTTFNYLSVGNEITRFLEAVHKTLKNRGLLLIDMNNYRKKPHDSYYRQTRNDSYEIRLSVSKRLIKNLNESIYFYFIRNLKSGEEFLALDQELNWAYTQEDVLNAGRPFFNLLKCYGDYADSARFTPEKSDRIILVLQKRNSQASRNDT
jgi:SAM-dependent methyltransferase